jgi:hypothetical protein
VLPPLQQAWAEGLFPEQLPEESRATCDHCAMAAPPGAVPDASAFTFKCCTYQPRVHNFLVGGVLLDPDPGQARGRAGLERLIDLRDGVSALGVHTAEWRLNVGREKPAAFGRGRALLCPHYQEKGGLCGIWRHREATCSTWFCKHERGAVGLAMWNRVKDLLICLEEALARHCALELDLGEEALGATARQSRAPDHAELFGPVTDETWRQRWGGWAGRERDFFGACAKVAAAMTPAQVLALGGSEARLLLKLARAAQARHGQPEVPLVPLHIGRLRLLSTAAGVARVETYRAYDPIELPESHFTALARFNGRPTGEVLRELASSGLELGPVELRRLVDFDLLVPEGR